MFQTHKSFLLFCFCTIIGIAGFVIGSNIWLIQTNAVRIFEHIDAVPYNDVALVLGTNPMVKKQYVNPYFTTRMMAAANLYHQQKIRHIIVSGDNSTKLYDEPSAMRDTLLARGVPQNAITLDYAGFRTLDSVVRVKEVFQQDKVTIISQEFHNYRALQIARKHGIEAIAFNAEKPFPHRTTKPEYREYFARCKAVLDLYIFNTKPKFLGEKINITL